MFCKSHYTPAAVTAHTAGLPISVIIHHFKIKAFFILQKHNAITAYAKTAVTEHRNNVRPVMIKV